MGTGYTRNDTTNNIADGNVINASDLDGEFDAIEAAFNATSGHTHDGTSAEGAPIVVIGPAQEWVVDGAALRPKLDDTYDIGTNTQEVRNLWVDGTANIDSLVADSADINGGTVDATVIGGSVPAAVTGTTITATTGFVGPLTGNAATATLAAAATALATNRSFSITGSVTAPAVNFNGTGNVVLNASIDPDLEAIAALSWSNNEAPIFHTGAWQKYTVSGYSRSLLTATDAGVARTTLGATAVGSSLFTAADAAGARTALDLGTIATQNANSVAVTGGNINGTVLGNTTPAAATVTSLAATSASVTAAEFASVDLVATTSNNGWRILRLVRGVNNFAISVLTNTATFVSNAYEITLGAAGATAHIFRVDNSERLRVENTTTTATVAGAGGFLIGLTDASGFGTPGFDFQSTNEVSGSAQQPVFQPRSSAGHLLGRPSRRWANVYLSAGPDVSSDERLKENFAPYTETDLAAGRLIRGGSFTIKATGKGSSGYRAQQIIAAFVEAGADERRPFELGLVSDGEHYGVCYELVNALRIEAWLNK
jgi:hypothetical protein